MIPKNFYTTVSKQQNFSACFYYIVTTSLPRRILSENNGSKSLWQDFFHDKHLTLLIILALFFCFVILLYQYFTLLYKRVEAHRTSQASIYLRPARKKWLSMATVRRFCMKFVVFIE